MWQSSVRANSCCDWLTTPSHGSQIQTVCSSEIRRLAKLPLFLVYSSAHPRAAAFSSRERPTEPPPPQISATAPAPPHLPNPDITTLPSRTTPPPPARCAHHLPSWILAVVHTSSPPDASLPCPATPQPAAPPSTAMALPQCLPRMDPVEICESTATADHGAATGFLPPYTPATGAPTCPISFPHIQPPAVGLQHHECALRGD